MIYLGNQQVGLNNSQNDEFVSYIENQELTNVQKERARNNIGAANEADLDSKVSDVQVNGTSVVVDGVANVPAGGDTYGVVKFNTNGNHGIKVSGTTGNLLIAQATSENIKAATESYRPVAPQHQHESAFYGLAKAAGSDEKDSILPVGQYTDAAKKAIRQMLGIPNFEWELIADVTVPENTTQFDITTDLSGQPFALRKMMVMAWLEAAPDTGWTSRYVSAYNLITYVNGNTTSIGATTKSYLTNGVATYFEYVSEICGPVSRTSGKASSAPTSTGGDEWVSNLPGSIDIQCYHGFRLSQYSANTPLIPKDSHIKIYGIRI